MDLTTLTIIHTALSFLALALGPVAIYSFFSPTPKIWTHCFLAFAVLVTASGFLFPFNGMTPAFGTGIAATLAFAAMAVAHYRFHYAGIWRAVYAGGMVASLYFLTLAGIAQAFLKIPPLHALAPNGNEPAFGIVQLANLALFIWIGRRAVKQFKPSPDFSSTLH